MYFFLFDILFCSDELWKRFLANSNENIHFALLMKPNQAFRLYCRRYPGLIGNTSIDYMRPWSEQVLTKVANVFLAGHPLIAENHLDGIVKHVVHVHNSLDNYSARFLAECDRLNFVTPKHYLEYIHTNVRLIGTRSFLVEMLFISFTNSLFDFVEFNVRKMFHIFRDLTEEKNRYLIERCNRMSAAISKCDELSENLNQLSLLAKEQRENMQLLKIKCKEMVDNIEKSKWFITDSHFCRFQGFA